MNTTNTMTRTRLLSVADVAALVARRGIGNVLREMADHIREDFLRWNQFQKSARTANHSPEGVIELMPTSDGGSFTFKYVNGHPQNPQRHLPTVMAFGVLADVATGSPVLLSELTLTTALRTAATSALAAMHMARRKARSMAVIGNGAQSEFQVHAFATLLGIREFRLFDTDRAATLKLLRNLSPLIRTGRINVEACRSTREAVRGTDIVTTVTADKRNAVILTDAMVEPGMHINAVGGDCPGKTELEAAILRRSRIVVEFEPQTRIEGELQQLPASHAVTELWRVLDGSAPGRESDTEVTVFDSVGFAVEDFSALRYLDAVSREDGLGTGIDIVPAKGNPKDLFGLLVGAGRTELAVA